MCLACRVGAHYECTEAEYEDSADDLVEVPCCCSGDPVGEVPPESAITVIGGYKENDEVKDATSTGRKRAAKLKPIIEGMLCEWARLRSAGGGVYPIVGCEGTLLTAAKDNGDRTGNVHHGPDKSTLNNSYENLHGICGKCHNRWHALNDPLYPQARPANGEPFIPLSGEVIPHDRHTLASAEELQRSELWWKMDKVGRPPYLEFVLGDNHE